MIVETVVTLVTVVTVVTKKLFSQKKYVHQKIKIKKSPKNFFLPKNITTQIVMKLKNSNHDKTQKLKL